MLLYAVYCCVLLLNEGLTWFVGGLQGCSIGTGIDLLLAGKGYDCCPSQETARVPFARCNPKCAAFVVGSISQLLFRAQQRPLEEVKGGYCCCHIGTAVVFCTLYCQVAWGRRESTDCCCTQAPGRLYHKFRRLLVAVACAECRVETPAFSAVSQYISRQYTYSYTGACSPLTRRALLLQFPLSIEHSRDRGWFGERELDPEGDLTSPPTPTCCTAVCTCLPCTAYCLPLLGTLRRESCRLQQTATGLRDWGIDTIWIQIGVRVTYIMQGVIRVPIWAMTPFFFGRVIGHTS